MVAAIIMLAFGVLSVVIILALIMGCFAAAYGLLRSASYDWNVAEPPKPGAKAEELRDAREEIEESVDRDYVAAGAALEKTLLEWEEFVDASLGVNIFDGVTNMDKWPLNSPEVRRDTGWAIEEYLQDCAHPATSTLEKAERTGRLDEKHLRLRASIGAHLAGSKTTRRK